MGRQIWFYQTEKDVEELCATLYPQGIRLFDRRGNEVKNYSEVGFYDNFFPGTRQKIGKFFIAYETTVFDKSLADSYEYPPFYKELIEYCICKESRSGNQYYNNGRFYLSNDVYNNVELVKLYNI